MNDLDISQIEVRDFKRYLLSRGWHQEEHPNKNILRFVSEVTADGYFDALVLPASKDLADSSKRLRDAITQLSSQLKIREEDVLFGITKLDCDIFKTRVLDKTLQINSLPLLQTTQLLGNLKSLIGYSAYTEVDPKPFFEKAGSASAEFVRHCRFGHTFRGSFGFTIECPLSIEPQLTMEGFDKALPFERSVMQRLASGLINLSSAVEKDDVTELTENFATGLNANMCRSLMAVYDAIDGNRIEYAISWSSEVAESAIVKKFRPVIFEGKAYEHIKYAAQVLEKSDEYLDSLIQGRVTALRSDIPPGQDEQEEFEHVVTMYWERERSVNVKIKVPLSPSQYKLACDAHRDGRAIKIYGVPKREGKFWHLSETHDFSVM